MRSSHCHSEVRLQVLGEFAPPPPTSNANIPWLNAVVTEMVREHIISQPGLAYVEPQSAAMISQWLPPSSRRPLIEIECQATVIDPDRGNDFALKLRVKRGKQEMPARFGSRLTTSTLCDFVAKAVNDLSKQLNVETNSSPPLSGGQLAARLSRRASFEDHFRTAVPRVFALHEAAALAAPSEFVLRQEALQAHIQHAKYGLSTPRASLLRALEHLEAYLALGGRNPELVHPPIDRAQAEQKTSQSSQPTNDIFVPNYQAYIPSRELVSQIQDLRFLDRAAGINWTAKDATDMSTILRRIVLERVRSGNDSSLYFEWLTIGNSTDEAAMVAADLAAEIKTISSAKEHLRRWLGQALRDRQQIEKPERVRRALDQLVALGDPDIATVAGSFYNLLPTNDPELIAAGIRLQAKNRTQSGSKQQRNVQFTRWKRKDGRSADLAPLRLEGNVVEFCTRDGDLRELPLSELADDDAARLTKWHNEQSAQ